MSRDYKKTVLVDRPEYSGRWLFVASPAENGILLSNGEPVSVFIDPTSGEASFTSTSAPSLRALGQEIFGWDDPSVPTVLSRLVTGEMELERVLNVYRYKYVKALASISQKRDWIAPRLSSLHNDLFTALIGGHFRGDKGGARRRDTLVQNGFEPKDLPVNFEHEHMELRRAIDLLKLEAAQLNRMDDFYREIIAVKPGFHERWFEPKSHMFANEKILLDSRMKEQQSGKTGANLRRTRVLLELHGRPQVATLDVKTVSSELAHYHQYSQCHATEGPCFMRRSASIQLRFLLPHAAGADEAGKNGHQVLSDNCHVFDYRKAAREGDESIDDILAKMEVFTSHSIRWRSELLE